jgi:serine/threonine protein kinase
VVDKWRYAGQESSEREIRILSKVSHANCIQMHAVFVTARRVYIVTDLVTGGELLDKCVSSWPVQHVFRTHWCQVCWSINLPRVHLSIDEIDLQRHVLTTPLPLLQLCVGA